MCVGPRLPKPVLLGVGVRGRADVEPERVSVDEPFVVADNLAVCEPDRLAQREPEREPKLKTIAGAVVLAVREPVSESVAETFGEPVGQPERSAQREPERLAKFLADRACGVLRSRPLRVRRLRAWPVLPAA